MLLLTINQIFTQKRNIYPAVEPIQTMKGFVTNLNLSQAIDRFEYYENLWDESDSTWSVIFVLVNATVIDDLDDKAIIKARMTKIEAPDIL